MFDLYRYPFLSDKKNQQIILIVFSVIWTGVLLWFGLIPAVRSALALSEEQGKASELIATIDNKIAAIEQAQQEYIAKKDAVKLVSAGVPDDPKVITFINRIATLAQNNALNIFKLDYGGEATEGSIAAGSLVEGKPVVSFSITVFGDYSGVANFVKTVEQLPRLVNVNAISIVINEEENDPGQTPEEGAEGAESSPAGESTGPSLRLILDGEFYYQSDE